MKRLIQPIGDFWKIDKAGYIINPASKKHITPNWQPVINDIIEIYKNNLSCHLHSIYLRGSVAFGNAVLSFSDVDTFALIYPKQNEEWRWKQASFQSLAVSLLKKKYSFVEMIEMQLATFNENQFVQNNPKLAMVIKTQAVCVYGENIASKIKKYKPNHEVCLNYRWLEEDIYSFLKKIKSSEKLEINDCRELMKIIVRVGMEIVVEKEQRFTTDLYPCYQIFSKYFPEKKKEMHQALEWYLNPITNKKMLENYLKKFGQWLICEIANFKS